MNTSNIYKFPGLSFDFLPEIEGSNSKAFLKYCEINPGLSFEFCQELFVEFYKFFHIYAQKINKDASPLTKTFLCPVEIAKVWEFHVQNTAKYPLLCEKFNQKYIHYHPEIYNFAEEAVERGLKELYEETLKTMKLTFGVLNQKIWVTFEDVKQGYQNTFNVSLKRLKTLIQDEGSLNTKITQIIKDASDTANFLFPTLNVKENSEVKGEVIEKIEKIKFPKNFMQILCQKLLISPDVATSLVHEYKKFLLMSVISALPIAPSGFVDEVWHLHMLFTREYLETCRLLKGNVIVHVPLIENSVAEKENLQGFYQKTVQLYEKIFGKREEAFWPEHGEKGVDAKMEHTFIWINSQ